MLRRIVQLTLLLAGVEWDITSVGVGDLLRQEILKGTELGKESEAVMKAGGSFLSLSHAIIGNSAVHRCAGADPCSIALRQCHRSITRSNRSEVGEA